MLPRHQVTFHDGLVLLECRDEHLLDELMLEPLFREAALRLLPPRHALLDPARVEALVPRLRERGYPVRLDG